MKRLKHLNGKRFPVWFAAVISAVSGCVILMCPEEAANAVRNGIEMCGTSVIPSLFPMMFVSQYMINSGAAELAGVLLDKPTRVLFGLPGVCGVALLTAFVGGYPAGARAAESLVESGRITRTQGEQLANMAFCSGPGFSIGMIGAMLYHNKSAGLLILTAQVISCIIIGTAQRLISFKLYYASESNKAPHDDPASHSDAFVRSAVVTASTMLNMCSFILLFQVVASMLDVAGVNHWLGNLTETLGLGDAGRYLLPCVTEVTGGSMISVKYGLPLTAFVAGFGGFSVHFQNFAVCRAVCPRKSVYLFTRIVQGAVCSASVSFALTLPCFAELSQTAAKVTVGGLPVEFSTVSGGFGCAMLIMCLMSVICLPQRQKELNNCESYKTLRKKHCSLM